MMNRRIVQVFLYELRRNLRRKGYLFMTFGIPALALAALIAYQFITTNNRDQTQGNGNDTASQLQKLDFQGITKAGYVDLSGMFSAPSGPLANIFVAYPDEASAQADLNAGKIDVYYIIAADYAISGDVSVNLPKLALNKITGEPIKQLVYSQIKGASPTLLARLLAPANIEEGQGLNEGTKFGVVYVLSIVFVGGVFITSGYLMQSIIGEKESRLIEILIVSIRPTQLLVGKILGLGVLGLLQITVWGTALYLLAKLAGILNTGITLLLNLSIPSDIIPIVLVYFILGYLLFAAAYGAVGAITNSTREGAQYAIVFTLPAAFPFYFLALFTQSPDGTLPVILSLFPLTSPLSMIMRLSLQSIAPVPVWQIVLSVVLLALSVAALMWAAGRLFRVQSLLAGHTPKWREIPSLLRG
jgi:ABC-2 type transport system permease protein